MKNTPIFFLTLSFLSGSIAASFIADKLSLSAIFFTCFAIVFLFASIYLYIIKKYFLLSFSILIVFFLLGFASILSYEQKTSKILSKLPFYQRIEISADIEEVSFQKNFKRENRVTLNSDNLKFNLFTKDSSFISGKKIKGTAELLPLSAPENFSAFDFRSSFYRKGIYGELNNFEGIVLPDTVSNISFAKTLNEIHRNIYDNLCKIGLSEKCSGFCCALIFGRRDFLDKSIKNNFSNAGVIHTLSVSGLHVGIFAAFIFFITTFLKKRKILRNILCISLIWFYAIFVGFSPSVIRAAGMFSVMLLALQSKRRYFALEALSLMAVLTLVFSPQHLSNLGFQMSYIATLSLIVVFPILNKKLNIFRNKILKWAFCSLILTFTAQIALIPILIYHFDYLTLLFPLSNFVIVPVISFVLIPMSWIVSLFSILNIKISIFNFAYEKLVDFVDSFSAFIAEKDLFALSDFKISFELYVFIFLLTIFLALWIKKVKYNIYFLLSSICLFLVLEINTKKPEFLICYKNGKHYLYVNQKEMEIEENSEIFLEDRNIKLIFSPKISQSISFDKAPDFVIIPAFKNTAYINFWKKKLPVKSRIYLIRESGYFALYF